MSTQKGSAPAPASKLAAAAASAAVATVASTARPTSETAAAPAAATASMAGASPAAACPLAKPAPFAVEDRRITRSKRALRDALVELIEERGLTNFSASDLCARADLNRGTLYNNFGDMEGLLAALEDDIMDDLENLQSCMQRLSLKDVLRYRVNKKPMPFLVKLFDYLREQGDFLHAIMGPKGDPSFGPRVRDAVCTEIIQTILHERYRNDPSPFVQYYVAFYASAYLGVITHWIETGMKESSQEMALVAMRLFFIKPGDPIRL